MTRRSRKGHSLRALMAPLVLWPQLGPAAGDGCDRCAAGAARRWCRTGRLGAARRAGSRRRGGVRGEERSPAARASPARHARAADAGARPAERAAPGSCTGCCARGARSGRPPAARSSSGSRRGSPRRTRCRRATPTARACARRGCARRWRFGAPGRVAGCASSPTPSAAATHRLACRLARGRARGRLSRRARRRGRRADARIDVRPAPEPRALAPRDGRGGRYPRQRRPRERDADDRRGTPRGDRRHRAHEPGGRTRPAHGSLAARGSQRQRHLGHALLERRQRQRATLVGYMLYQDGEAVGVSKGQIATVTLASERRYAFTVRTLDSERRSERALARTDGAHDPHAAAAATACGQAR